MIYNLFFSITYTSILLWIYDIEFTHYWTYMRFNGNLNFQVFFIAVILSATLALLLPTKKSARGYILIVAHYFYLLPSIVYLTFNRPHQDYVIALAISIFFIYFGSMIPTRTVSTPTIKPTKLLALFFIFIGVTLTSQIYFGALDRFNLNMERVYEFREVAASAMPAVFGYIFSNVANVLIPSSIALALHLRKKNLASIGVLASIILFGMSHHKSIVFAALMVFILYLAAEHIKNLPALALLPISLVAFCAIEVLYYAHVADERQLGIFTSYFVRRALLVPPMLDASAVELFSESAKYYWSTSRLGLGISTNPHDVAAPFLIGIHFFDDPGMSANPGNIGSGYSHAGLLGVIIYSLFTGILISFVNTIGKKGGHSLAAAISTPIVLTVLTSTDLTTALLTHGMLILLIILLLVPRQDTAPHNAEERMI